MIARYDTKTVAIAAVALVVTVALLIWGYGAHKKRETDKAILALVTVTGARLRDALGIEVAPPTADRAQVAKKLDEHAATADENLQAFKRLDTGSNQALADAADDYLLTAREILKRQSEGHRYRLLMGESEQALRDHMRRNDHSTAWVQGAVKAKERMNKDFRGYSLSAETFGKLLGSFPSSQRKIAAHVPPAVLIDGTLISDARDRVAKDVKQVAADYERLNQIEAFR